MNTAIDRVLLEALSERVKDGLAQVLATIAAVGRDPSTITIVGVTKGWGPEAPLAGLANGLTWFGENYADELVGKAVSVQSALDTGIFNRPGADTPKWTFQGRLQSNKINRLKGIVSLWQTIDSVERAEALGSRVSGADVFVQVVLDRSGERSGCEPSSLPAVLDCTFKASWGSPPIRHSLASM
jgi:PLP dependent protein